jgi:hypothetical protein
MPIRIMHVVDSLGKGGLENGLVNLIERLDPKRFEHIVFALRSLGANADRLPRDRVRVRKQPMAVFKWRLWRARFVKSGRTSCIPGTGLRSKR